MQNDTPFAFPSTFARRADRHGWKVPPKMSATPACCSGPRRPCHWILPWSCGSTSQCRARVEVGRRSVVRELSSGWSKEMCPILPSLWLLRCVIVEFSAGAQLTSQPWERLWLLPPFKPGCSHDRYENTYSTRSPRSVTRAVTTRTRTANTYRPPLQAKTRGNPTVFIMSAARMAEVPPAKQLDKFSSPNAVAR